MLKNYLFGVQFTGNSLTYKKNESFIQSNMKDGILNFIAQETNGRCYQSFRYCADDEIRMPTLDYEDKGSDFSLVKNSYGETEKKEK